MAAVLNLYSHAMVGWSMHSEMTAQLVADAAMTAIWRRGKPVELLHHSDLGSQQPVIRAKTSGGSLRLRA